MDVRLVIFKADGSSKQIPVRPGRYVIGRRPDAELRIPLPSVSRDHCELVHDGRSLSVRDLGSSNGTFKNQERIKQATLGAGDRLAVGTFVMTVQIDGKPSNLSPPPTDEDDAHDLMDTPVPRPAAEAARGRSADESDDESDLDETVTRTTPVSPATGGRPGGDDSSIFEFDFDFEDDDRPKL